MKKPESLRAAIVAALPILATDPDQLKIWIDEGRVVARRAKALGSLEPCA